MARTRRSRRVADAPTVAVPASSDAEPQPAQTRGRTRTSQPAQPSKRQESVESTTVAGPSRPLPSQVPASSIRNTSVDSVEIGRRALETPSILRHRDNTGLDLADDSIFGDLGDSFADGDVPFGEDIAVPGSGSTTRSWSHLKPRSRQSSFVGRNDPPIRPSSRGGAGANSSTLASSLNIGAFRRRAREPSILGTTRRARQGPRSETSGRGAQSDLESDAGDFAPDAESTPLNTRRRTTRASLAANTSTATTTTRKRKSDALTAAAAAAAEEEEEERAAKALRVERDSDSDSEISELDSPQMPPSTPLRQREMTPVNLDEINAPPASSGSEDEGDMWPDIRTLAKRRRRASLTTPLRAGAGSDDEILSDVSSPPSLTHSPNITGKGARGRAAASHRVHEAKPLTTADLANLLPKRRYKKARRGGDASDEEGGDEDEEEQEDEAPEGEDVEEVPLTRTRGGRISRPPSRAGSTATGNNNKQLSTPAGRTRRAAKLASKTYGRQSSDKENNSSSHLSEDDDDEEGGDSQFRPLADDTFGESTSGVMDFQSVEELKRATKKFVEVDKWALEYEEVAESFSPKGAR